MFSAFKEKVFHNSEYKLGNQRQNINQEGITICLKILSQKVNIHWLNTSKGNILIR